MSGKMKNFGMVLVVVLAVAAVAQAEVIFQEDFSGYTAGPYPMALNTTAQVGTWTLDHNGSPLVDVRLYPLMDGSTGPCLMVVDDSTGTGRPRIFANTIDYTAAPISISYNVKMRGTGTNVLAVFARQSDGTDVAYSKLQRANTTSAWQSFYQSGAGGESHLLSLETWYKVVMDFPVMPETGTFVCTASIFDAAGTEIFTTQLNSYTAEAGPELITSFLFSAPGVGDVTNVLLDDIVVTAVPEPATMGLLVMGGIVGLLRRRK